MRSLKKGDTSDIKSFLSLLLDIKSRKAIEYFMDNFDNGVIDCDSSSSIIYDFYRLCRMRE